jgi:hypothetical protein
VSVDDGVDLMRRKFKRVIGLLLMLATVAAIGFGGAYFFTGVMFGGFLWLFITGFGSALLASIIMNWLGFSLSYPLILSSRTKLADIVVPVGLSTMMLIAFVLFIYTGIDVFYYNQGGFDVFIPEALQAAQVASVLLACVMSFLFAVVVDWLGFRVQYKPEEEAPQLEKAKRTSRIDALFADISEEEIRELRYRLLQDSTQEPPRSHAQAQPLDEDDPEVDWYEEKAKGHRLQAER